MEYLILPQAKEELLKETAVQKFCKEVIMPKLSDEKRRAVIGHMQRGISIDGAMAAENIKITAC